MKSFLLLLFASTLLSSASYKDLFPTACEGTWKGTLMIYAQGSLKDSIPSTFTVGRIDDSTWTWRTEYHASQPIVKDYVLKLSDANTGHYILDEKNGIDLDAHRVGPSLYSMFEVEEKVLTSTYTLLDKNKLLFQITFGVPDAEKTGNDITNYKITTVQKAYLTKQP